VVGVVDTRGHGLHRSSLSEGCIEPLASPAIFSVNFRAAQSLIAYVYSATAAAVVESRLQELVMVVLCNRADHYIFAL